MHIIKGKKPILKDYVVYMIPTIWSSRKVKTKETIKMSFVALGQWGVERDE